MKRSFMIPFLRLAVFAFLVVAPVTDSGGMDLHHKSSNSNPVHAGGPAVPQGGPVVPAPLDDVSHAGYNHRLRTYYTKDAEEVRNALAMIDMGKHIGMNENASRNYREKLKTANKILLLADGFENGKGHHPMAPIIQQIVPTHTIIYKTGYDCPFKFKVEGNIVNVNLNHQEKMTVFHKDEMDVVLMRKGLCLCSKTETTCGGLRMCCSDDSKVFFKSVAKVLNKNNREAYAFLGGWHHNNDSELESDAQDIMEEVLVGVSETYPSLEIKMIYLNDSKPEFLGVEMKVRSLAN